jgi:alpha-L-fucosidase
VDVSIRDGWFWNKEDNSSVKNGKKLFDIYVNSVGNNCTLLLNVPPTDKGVFHSKDAKALKKLGSW